MSRRWVFSRVTSYYPILFSLKINTIVKSVLKGSETFVSFIRGRTKSHLRALRLIQLCVNSVKDLVSNDRFKFPTSKTVCILICNQRKQFAESSIMLDNPPIKVVTEARFLGVIFHRTLSYINYVHFLNSPHVILSG